MIFRKPVFFILLLFLSFCSLSAYDIWNFRQTNSGECYSTGSCTFSFRLVKSSSDTYSKFTMRVVFGDASNPVNFYASDYEATVAECISSGLCKNLGSDVISFSHVYSENGWILENGDHNYTIQLQIEKAGSWSDPAEDWFGFKVSKAAIENNSQIDPDEIVCGSLTGETVDAQKVECNTLIDLVNTINGTPWKDAYCINQKLNLCQMVIYDLFPTEEDCGEDGCQDDELNISEEDASLYIETIYAETLSKNYLYPEIIKSGTWVYTGSFIDQNGNFVSSNIHFMDRGLKPSMIKPSSTIALTDFYKFDKIKTNIVELSETNSFQCQNVPCLPVNGWGSTQGYSCAWTEGGICICEKKCNWTDTNNDGVKDSCKIGTTVVSTTSDLMQDGIPLDLITSIVEKETSVVDKYENGECYYSIDENPEPFNPKKTINATDGIYKNYGEYAMPIFIENQKQDISSCEQYVYEKYYDYSLYKDFAAKHKDNPLLTAIFAFEPLPINPLSTLYLKK